MNFPVRGIPTEISILDVLQNNWAWIQAGQHVIHTAPNFATSQARQLCKTANWQYCISKLYQHQEKVNMLLLIQEYSCMCTFSPWGSAISAYISYKCYFTSENTGTIWCFLAFLAQTVFNKEQLKNTGSHLHSESAGQNCSLTFQHFWRSLFISSYQRQALVSNKLTTLLRNVGGWYFIVS